MNARSRPAIYKGPGVAAALVAAGDDLIRIFRVHNKLVNTGVLIDVENFGPTRAAVAGLV